jgi:hypothetical protein
MPEAREKPSIDIYNQSLKKWEDGLEQLKSTPLNPKALKDWFDNLICGKCRFCEYYIKCDKCPLMFALACSRVSDPRPTIWQIWFTVRKGDKENAIKLTMELIDKIKSLKDLFA